MLKTLKFCLVGGIAATLALTLDFVVTERGSVRIEFSDAEARPVHRGGARRTARRTTRRTVGRAAVGAAAVHSYYYSLPGGCTLSGGYYYCGGVYYQQTVQDGATVYVVVNP